MRRDGTGRSNAVPILQFVFGGAMVLVAVLAAMWQHELWLALVFLAAGAMQVVVGVLTYRRNQRLDREEVR